MLHPYRYFANACSQASKQKEPVAKPIVAALGNKYAKSSEPWKHKTDSLVQFLRADLRPLNIINCAGFKVCASMLGGGWVDGAICRRRLWKLWTLDTTPK